MALSSTFQKKILSNICPPKVERKMVLMPKANDSPTFGGKMHSVRSSQLCFLIKNGSNKLYNTAISKAKN
jgi:hypothetical protein